MDAESEEVGEHDDGHGAGSVGVFARGVLGELRVGGCDGFGEEFVECGGVAGGREG